LKTYSGGTYFGLDFTNGRSSLQDINGDGIPDLIWQLPNTSSGIQFQAGQLDADRKLSFSTLKTVQAETGITPNKFNRMRSWSNSTTVNAYLGTEYLGASVGHSWDWSKGKNTHFFTDANADGIADLVIKGDVAFGSVDHANGDVKYLKTSELTSNPIINFNPIDEDEVDPDESFPLEIVRSWTAPVSGTITYSSTLIVPSSSTDGVNASIELFSNNTTTILKPSQSFSGGQNVSLNASNNLNVNKGDMLFFRLNAKSDPSGDKSTWNPSVTYVSAPEVSEGNSYNWLNSSSSNGFLLSSKAEARFSNQEKVRVDIGSASLPTLTDEVTLGIEITYSNGNSTSTDYSTYTHPANTSLSQITINNFTIPTAWNDLLGSASNGFSLPSGAELSVRFYVSAASNVDWNTINWSPSVQSKKGQASWSTSYPAIDLRGFFEMVKGRPAINDVANLINGGQEFMAMPLFSNSILQQLYPTGSGPAKHAVLTCKTDGVLLKSYHIDFTPSAINVSTNSVPTSTIAASQVASYCSQDEVISASQVVNDNFYLCYYTEDVQLAQILGQNGKVLITRADGGLCTDQIEFLEPSVFTVHSDRHIGSEFLGWGQFGWDGTPGGISPSQMVVPALIASQYPDLSTMSAQQIEDYIYQYSLSPSNSHFTPLYPRRKEAQIAYFGASDGWMNPFNEYSGVLQNSITPSIGGYVPGQSNALSSTLDATVFQSDPNGL